MWSPTLFTPTFQYFYTDFSAISKTFCNSVCKVASCLLTQILCWKRSKSSFSPEDIPMHQTWLPEWKNTYDDNDDDDDDDDIDDYDADGDDDDDDLASIFGPPSTAIISALLAKLELEEWRPGSFIIMMLTIILMMLMMYLIPSLIFSCFGSSTSNGNINGTLKRKSQSPAFCWENLQRLKIQSSQCLTEKFSILLLKRRACFAFKATKSRHRVHLRAIREKTIDC